MYKANITQARLNGKFMHLQSGAMASIQKPTATVYSGPTLNSPSQDCPVREEDNPAYGRIFTSMLFTQAPGPGALPELPLQLGDVVRYEVVNGSIHLVRIERPGVVAAAQTVQAGANASSDLADASCQELVRIGFEDVASWRLDGGKIAAVGDDSAYWQKLSEKFPQALYAFCVDGTVKYIGKTVSTIKGRFQGYRNPGNRKDGPNVRCNTEIKQCLAIGNVVRILVMPNRSPLRWDRFEINITAGLEDALIDEFQPDWNA